MRDVIPIERALISVSDKTDVDRLAEGLYRHNPDMDILSSGGTATYLRERGHRVREVSEYTGMPESPNGFLKTLHPKIFGGILHDEDFDDERAYNQVHGMYPINLVVFNFYPLAEHITAGRDIEYIRKRGLDIGGPSNVSAAVKAFTTVAVVTRPSSYPELLLELEEKGGTTLESRWRWAVVAGLDVANYDAEKAKFLASLTPDQLQRFYLGG